MTFSPLDLRSKNIFKRCVTCNPLTSASCPACNADQDCTLIPATCDQCPQYACVATSESGAVPGLTPVASSHKGPAAPVIAGSVIGGVILIAVGVWLVWKYALNGRRRDSISIWQPAEYPMEKSGPNSIRTGATSAYRDDMNSRASTHTYHSMASTVLTRASNVIQIAFIPGVTTRSTDEPSTTPRTLVPPMPPIPMPTSPLSRNASGDDLHFYPGQLRDSSYSTGDRDAHSRMSMASSSGQSLRPSIARGSIASTIYGSSAVAVTPVKPSMISLKSFGSSPHNSTTPKSPAFNKTDSMASSAKSMILQMPVSRENGELSNMPPSRVRSLHGLKPKAVMISKNKGTAAQEEASSSSSSSSIPPVPVLAPHLSTLSEERKTPLIGSSDSRKGSNASVTQSLLRNEFVSGPFTDAAAADSDDLASSPGSGTSPFNDAHAF